MRFLQYISKETVILQTRSVQDSGFLLEGAKDMKTFYQQQSQILKEAELPPFGFLSAVMVRSKDAELSLKESQRLYDIMSDILQKEVDVWEPQPDRTPVLRGQFRYTIMAKAKDPSSMMRVTGVLRGFRAKKNVTVTLNVMT